MAQVFRAPGPSGICDFQAPVKASACCRAACASLQGLLPSVQSLPEDSLDSCNLQPCYWVGHATAMAHYQALRLLLGQRRQLHRHAAHLLGELATTGLTFGCAAQWKVEWQGKILTRKRLLLSDDGSRHLALQLHLEASPKHLQPLSCKDLSLPLSELRERSC